MSTLVGFKIRVLRAWYTLIGQAFSHILCVFKLTCSASKIQKNPLKTIVRQYILYPLTISARHNTTLKEYVVKKSAVRMLINFNAVSSPMCEIMLEIIPLAIICIYL